MTRLIAFVLALGVVFPTPTSAETKSVKQRWLYLQFNLQVKENVPMVSSLLRRAAAVGYNGAVLADYKLNILSRVPEWYFTNIAEVKKVADEVGIELIPCIAPFGYSSGLLTHDPNLAEGLPVRNATLVVSGEELRLQSELKDPLPGGDFEKLRGAAFAGWDFQDEPGKLTFVDREIRHSGRSSLRMERRDGGEGYVNCRVSKLVKVQPWRQYHLSVWFKSQDFRPTSEIRAFAMDSNGRVLAHSDVGVQTTQDWKQSHIVFNSLTSQEVRIYIGIWGPKSGKLWIDDVALEEVAFLNVVDRKTCPIQLTTTDGAVLEPGRDYEPIRDTRMAEAMQAGGFEVYHAPPKVKVLSGGRLQAGQKVLASYYHAVSVHDQQVAMSLSDEKSFELVADQVRRVNKLLAPKRFFLSHDEIRVANWDRPLGASCGKVLADNVARCYQIVKSESPQAEVCVWSDMFDPSHNAVNNYYLVNGTLSGSWEGLPKEMTLVNWNSGKPKESLGFFAERGHRQVLAGYYDGPVGAIADWQKVGARLPGVEGAMYTTWQARYEDIEAFARSAWGGKPAQR